MRKYLAKKINIQYKIFKPSPYRFPISKIKLTKNTIPDLIKGQHQAMKEVKMFTVNYVFAPHSLVEINRHERVKRVLLYSTFCRKLW